jgi:hypothetical protein
MLRANTVYVRPSLAARKARSRSFDSASAAVLISPRGALKWKLAMSRLGYVDSSKQIISIRQQEQEKAAVSDPGKGDRVA